MPSVAADPAVARDFALSVVARLRRAGHEAYWAGGCVRDELLGRTPADYDVATAARPADVQEVFGRRRTLAIGAAFGVITVVGPPGAGQVEVATFRADAPSTDGRHPDGVTFCSAREDARRRDFTINGMFLDPLAGTVHDFVGGRDDLAAGIVRAIGVPAQRFAEDHLRMLRAIRFTAFFGFVLDAATREALERMAHLVRNVSAERIAAELRAMTSRAGRREALELLEATGLAREVLPDIAPGGVADRPRWAESGRIIAALDEPDLPLALAVLGEHVRACLPRLAARLRLSTDEGKKAAWLAAAAAACGTLDAATLGAWPRSRLQPWLAHESTAALADLLRARAAAGRGDPEAAAWFSAEAARPRIERDPPPLLGGADLLAAGMSAGPGLGATLARVRALQLDGLVTTKEEALAAALGR